MRERDVIKPADKDMLNVAIRYIEQLLTSKGEYMTSGQIYDLLRKLTIKHISESKDRKAIAKTLMNNIKYKGE